LHADIGPIDAAESIRHSNVSVHSIRIAGGGLCDTEQSHFGLRSFIAIAIAAFTRFCVEVPGYFDVINVRTGEYARIEPVPDGTLADRYARELGSDWRACRREDRR
jgi:hypothetical protein